MPALGGIFIFIVSIFALSLCIVGVEVVVYFFRNVDAPCKLCRRLNICCGYRYDLDDKPVPEFWLTKLRQRRSSTSAKTRIFLGSTASIPAPSSQNNGLQISNPVHLSPTLNGAVTGQQLDLDAIQPGLVVAPLVGSRTARAQFMRGLTTSKYA